MICKEILKKLEERWNPSFAMHWDNVGLLVGREEKDIRKVFVALDVTEETLDQALEFGADLLITHHPLLFSPVKTVNSRDFIGRRLIRMIQADLCYYAMHTNFDVKGMAKLNEESLGLCDTRVLEVTAEDEGICEGIGRVGMLKTKMTLAEFAQKVKKDLGIPDVRVYGDLQKEIRRAAVSGGSGKSMVNHAVSCEADVLVTGDIDYHTGIDSVARGLAVIDAGHYGTEYVFISYMEEQVKQMFPELSVGAARGKQPFVVI